jgi:hypothetical protein
MRKLLLLFLVAAPALAAQSVVTIPPNQCVWHEGDNSGWSATSLDESRWLPLTEWKVAPDQAQLWIRCHADLSALATLAHPAVQINFAAAYQLFLDGGQIGAFGNLHQGTFDLNTIRTFPISASQIPSSAATLALRVTRRTLATNSGPINGLINRVAEVRVGDASLLDAVRAQSVLARSSRYLPSALCFGVVGVVAVMLIALFLYDRTRREFLLLSITCLALATLRLNEFATASCLSYPIAACLFIVFTANVLLTPTQFPFFFALAGRRTPRVIQILIALVCLAYIPNLLEVFLPADHTVLLDNFNAAFIRPLALFLHIVLSFCPFIAFWPFSRIPRRLRPLAILCGLWGLADFVWFSIEITAFPLFGLPDVFQFWGVTLLEVRAFTTAGVIAALLALLFREQRQVTEERALFAGEVNAARNVQQYLIPEHLPDTPGFAIESEYRPSREVGGDFFQILPQTADGSLLIVIGDVAGKGIEAGMLATLIIGAVRTAASFTSDPARILALLNERLCGRGLVTCLALHIDQDGAATLVNAGHLPPFLNGKELAVDGALPLGAVPGLPFPVSHFTLAPGDSLLLMTDGVVEAQNSQGQLFGFERITQLLGSGAGGAALAHAAQAHGQQDDITVLTLTVAPVAVAHA